MSSLSIAPYFPFPRVKIVRQSVAKDVSIAWIEAEPDLRFIPLCSSCERKVKRVHSEFHRSVPVRDLDLATASVFVSFSSRRLFCPSCGIRVEKLEFVEPSARVTKRLARYIYDLCKIMTINDVANHLDLDWKTVKNIDKYFLEQEYGETDYSNLRILAIDEVSIRKGHNYLTVVLNYETGRVVWIGEGRKKKTLDKFFSSMTKEQREKIEAIALDMWKPFINCIRYWCPKAEIVFDLFHVVSEFNRVIDRVRNIEYRKANKEEKGVIKGSKFLLLTNKENLKPEKRPHLKELLEINKNLSTVYILKDLLKRIWRYRYPAWAKKALHNWYELAYESNIVPVIAFADRLRRHEEGILNHCSYPIATGIVEGTNNKIKVIQRNAYGFHDIRYFILKVKQAFP